MALSNPKEISKRKKQNPADHYPVPITMIEKRQQSDPTEEKVGKETKKRNISSNMQ
jgi:hypothetical protein